MKKSARSGDWVGIADGLSTVSSETRRPRPITINSKPRTALFTRGLFSFMGIWVPSRVSVRVRRYLDFVRLTRSGQGVESEYSMQNVRNVSTGQNQVDAVEKEVGVAKARDMLRTILDEVQYRGINTSSAATANRPWPSCRLKCTRTGKSSGSGCWM